MPKIAKEVSAVFVRQLTKPGHYPVGGVPGLLMHVAPTGSKYWVLRYSTGEIRTSSTGKPFAARRDYGIGPYPEITLAQAREKAREVRGQLREGIEPVETRNAARAARKAERAKQLTFREAARKFLASKTREFKNEKHAAQWASTLKTYAFPVVGSLPVDRIELAHIVKILDGLWTEKTETATRVRGRIEAVLNWSIVSGFREAPNPAAWKGNLDAILPKPTKLKNVRHHRALPVSEMHGFMEALRKREGMAARALEFLVLTAARSGEVRGAAWAEMDMAAKTWTVPASRMKAGKDHVVPLTDDAVKLLKGLKRTEGNDLLFPAPRGGQLSDMALAAVMKRMDVNAVPHGFRSTFRDWCSEFTNYPREVAEMALAHAIPSAVERAYRRGDLLAKRRLLMRDWCRFINAAMPTGDVLPIREAKA
jgi:integrase